MTSTAKPGAPSISGAIALCLLFGTASPPSPALSEEVGGPMRSFTLVSAEDIQQWEAEARLEQRSKSIAEPQAAGCASKSSTTAAEAPVIAIVHPEMERAIHSPVDVELSFSASPGSRIVPTTFRVCYVGLFTVDITDRLVGHSTVSGVGLKAYGAALPSGTHRLRLFIADDSHRIGVKDVEFHVD
jgi:hypothetical protein